ncbi:tetratricopeptide repeat protein [Bordetella petrii]|uniref:tetratricopeptide repeat protein n=1 Tax=Bordetella petrii TaxID=94624 RepID=UPI001E49F1F0|nr:tetratricopeptide repeat protein [Bordetella petrii]MCD0505570.1 hypothetical protein [Bordetella petrii]
MKRLSPRRLRLAAVLGTMLLAGCQGNKMESAWALIQQQQQEQALMRQSEDSADTRQEPTEPQLMLALIRENQVQGRYFASLAYIDAYRQRFGNSDQLDALQADALRRTGQEAQSEATYRKLLGGAQAAQGWHGLGLLAGARGDYAQAAQDLDRAVKLAPTDPQMLGDLGYARLRAGDSAGARVPLGMAAELDPGNTKILANMALLLLVEGNSLQAQHLMDRANLGQEARSQIFQMASQMQVRAHVPAPMAGTGRSDGTVRQVTQVSSGRDVVLPMLQPVMDRMINPPMVQ